MFDNSFDSSLSGLGNFSTYLDKDHLSSSLTVSSLQQLPSLNTPVDNAGNTLATARSVGTLTATQSFSDAVGSVDTNDYYSFNVGIQSNLTLSLTGLTANADVQLLNGSGGVITTSAKSGTTSESIASLLNTGNYFVRVYRSSGDTNYSLSLNATPIDNAGNTTATARAVGTLTATQSFSNWVGSVDTNDYYSFNVGTQSNLTLSLTGLTANADVELLNSSGTVITTAAATGTTSESITRLLSTGTYYARVYQSSGDTNYSLSLNATPVDNAGDNTGTARAVGTLTATQSFSDWVGSVDTNDYYSFNVGIQSNLTLSLTGLTANADVQLLNGSGGVITTSAKSGTTSESIASLLNTGTYFVRVYRSSGDTNYSLSLNATPIDNAGNTTATARAVGTLTATQSFSNWVGSLDTNDYYSFNVGTQSNLTLSLTGLTANADVELLNSSGTVITTAAATGTTSESITRLLSTGTYYARVYQSSGDTNYSLSLNATPVDNAGDNTGTARAVGTLTATQSFSDWVGSVDTNDYYSFNVGIQSNLTLSLTGLTANADVQLLNGSGGVITTSAKSGTTSESIASLLNTGTYFVRVYRSSGDTNYSLSLNATPIDNAGNTTATARAVGTLTATQSFSNWVGSLDTNDYYSFNVGTQSNLTLSLTGLTANADVELLNSSGTVITTAAATGTTSESITRLLSTGTYYARVYQSSGDTNYSLSLNATPVDNAGDNTGTARAVGTLTGTQSFSDWVGSVDTNDYYSFNVGIQSNLTLSLTGLTANADVQLLNGSGGVITTSAKSGTTSESIASLLNTGTYFIRVYQSSGDTNYSLSLNMIEITPNPNPTPEDWYNQNLKDAQIITLTRSLAADGNLSRNDMISIFRDAKDGSVIDANELTDLRTLVSNSTLFTMADSVKVLSNKIANSDVANTRSGFGNLSAGSNATQMENLIGKWFLGNNRPGLTSSSYSYQYVSGSLFQNGLSANDIDQGALGDCYYVATLASIAQEKPDYIQNMFTDNGDNTFTVRFYRNGVADYVTVDRYLPTNLSGRAAYAGWGGSSYTSTTNELWVALAEKAYAQLAESGWSRSSTSTNSYADIEGGWMGSVISQVAGLGSSAADAAYMTQAQLINLVNSNQILTVGFNYAAGNTLGVVNNHAYTITAYNATNQTFHLRNPWGTRDVDVTWSQLVSLRGVMVWSNT